MRISVRHRHWLAGSRRKGGKVLIVGMDPKLRLYKPQGMETPREVNGTVTFPGTGCRSMDLAMLQTLSAKQQLDQTAEGFDAGKGLRFRTGRQLLHYLQSRSEETPCRESDAVAWPQYEAAEDAAASVDATVLELMYSWNHHDVHAWAACFTEDADYINVVGEHWKGRAEIEVKQRELHATALRNSEMRVSEWTIRFLGSASCLVHMNWEMKGGNARKRRGLLSLVLVPDAGRWRVTAAHNSDTVPVLS